MSNASIHAKLNSDYYKNKLEYPSKPVGLDCPNSNCKARLPAPYIEITKEKFGLTVEFNVLTRFCSSCGLKIDNFIQETFDSYTLNMTGFRAEESRLSDLFRTDAIESCGLSGHPKADKAFSRAWEKGHSSGIGEVYNILDELAQLISFL